MDCIFPTRLSAGLTFSKLVDLALYPAPTWTLSVVMRGPGPVDLVAAAEGTSHRLAADAETTGTWSAGTYWYSARVTGPGGLYEVATGQVVVVPDLAAAGDVYDGRTHAARALAAIEAVLEKRATLDQERYRINNRELYRTPTAQLTTLRDYYRAEVKREKRQAAGKSLFSQAVRVRF